MTSTEEKYTLYVASDQLSNRLRYVLNELIRHTPFKKVCLMKTDEMSSDIPQGIWYSKHKAPSNWLHIVPSDILVDYNSIHTPEQPVWIDGHPVFYRTKQSKDKVEIKDFDLLASMFYLLSRAEEYGAVRDRYGRFEARKSFAFKYQLLTIPVVDNIKEWIIGHLRGEKFSIELHRHQVTIDIDMAYAWKHKPSYLVLYHGLNLLMKGKLDMVKKMYQVYFGKERDPYESFPSLEREISEQIEWRYFFLSIEKKTTLDRNLPITHPAIRKYVAKYLHNRMVGLHPSSRTFGNPEVLMKEKNNLSNILQMQIVHSRQHYLILQLPETYRMLIDSGITHDHSMVYHDDIGYRSGTAYPFTWYDLDRERETKLNLVPYQVMDVTLKNYLKMNPLQAVQQVRSFMVKNSSRPLGLIWHNSSVSEAPGWEGWTECYAEILELLLNNYANKI